MSSVANRFLPNASMWAVGLGTTLGFASSGAAPWIVFALAQTGRWTAQQAALMNTVEMLAMGGTMALLSPVIDRLPYKALVLVGAFVLLAAQSCSLLTKGVAGMACVRFVSGLGFGVVYAVASAVGAATAQPERTYAAAGTISLILGMMLNPLLGIGTEYFGYEGVFVSLGIFCLILALALAFVPIAQAPLTQRPRENHAPPLRWLPVIAVLLVMTLFASATNGVFVFANAVADSVGLRGSELGTGLVFVSLFSSLGGVLATRMSTRHGHYLPLVGGLLLMGLSSIQFMAATTRTHYWVGYTAWCAIYWFVYPYIFGLTVLVDPHGRLATATGSTLVLMGAAGSAVAGAMAENSGTRRMSLLSAALCVAAAAVGIWVLRNRTGAGGEQFPVSPQP